MGTMAAVMAAFIAVHAFGGSKDPYRSCRLRALPAFLSTYIATYMYITAKRLERGVQSAPTEVFEQDMLICAFVAGTAYYVAYGIGIMRS